MIKTTIELANMLDKTDKTILRCLENDISIPTEWKTYRSNLRSLINAGGGEPPDQPPYPTGS